MKGIAFPGLNTQSLNRHYQLIPLLVAIAGGAVLAGGYLLRLATRNPDCSWDKTNNPHPWQKMKPSDQYKFHSVKLDYKNLKHPEERPDI